MTFAGARGRTADEMAAALHFGGDGAALHAGFARLARALAPGPKSPFELSVANRLFAQQGHPFEAAFLALVREHYGAPVELVDFRAASEAARRAVNRWVEEHTRGRIKDLLAPGVVDARTRMVLANAVYLRTKWAQPFDRELTRPRPFSSGGARFDVPTMNATRDLGYAVRGGATVLSLPYQGSEGRALSMLIVMPRRPDGMAALEAGLSQESLAAWARELPIRRVELHLPRFKVERTLPLAPSLAKLGMKAAFDCSEHTEADFSGMDGRRDLCISAVVHKAFVAVDESGTEAAAATAVLMSEPDSIPPPAEVVRVDHPFLFAIRDDRSGTLLFLGRVVDPRG